MMKERAYKGTKKNRNCNAVRLVIVVDSNKC